MTIEVYQGVVKPLSERTGHEFVEFVAQHVQPYTVGWSNIIDYMRLEQVWFKGITSIDSLGFVHSYRIYRVAIPIMHLDWVDLDWGVSPAGGPLL